MGGDQGEQPVLGKEGRWPMDIIPTSAAAVTALAVSEDAAQSPQHPVIEVGEDEFSAMLEVLKPAAQSPIQVRDDGREALPVRAPALDTNRVLQLGQALASGPTFPPFEVIPQKVEAAFGCGVYDPRLGRVQLQSRCRGPALYPFQRLAGFRLAPAQNHEVIRVPHHLESGLSHQVVERIEIEIGEQRADDRPLRSPLFGCPSFRRPHHLGGEKRLQQSEPLAIRHLFPYSRQKGGVGNGVEVALQVGIDYPTVSCLQQGIDPPQRVLAAPIRSEPVAVRREVPFENRLQHRAERRLHHPVAHCRNPQRTLLLAARLGNPHPSDRLRTIATVLQHPRELFQVGFQMALELLHRHVVHASRSAVPLHACEGSPQIRQRVDLVHETEPLASQHSLFESGQHAFRPNRGFDPGPSSPNLSGGFSPSSGHYVRGCLQRSVRHVSTFLRSLRSRPVTALPRYYGRSDSCPPSPRALPSGLVAGSFSGQVSLIHVPGLPALPPPTTPRGPGITLARYAGTPDLPGVFSGAWASPLTCRLAAHARPNRVRYPADGSFTSGCSPPRLAATQLPRLQLCAPEEDFHLSDHARFQAHRFFAALRMTCELTSDAMYSRPGRWSTRRPTRSVALPRVIWIASGS